MESDNFQLCMGFLSPWDIGNPFAHSLWQKPKGLKQSPCEEASNSDEFIKLNWFIAG